MEQDCEQGQPPKSSVGQPSSGNTDFLFFFKAYVNQPTLNGSVKVFCVLVEYFEIPQQIRLDLWIGKPSVQHQAKITDILLQKIIFCLRLVRVPHLRGLAEFPVRVQPERTKQAAQICN